MCTGCASSPKPRASSTADIARHPVAGVAPAKAVPSGAAFCDASLDVDARVADILSRLIKTPKSMHGMLETSWGENTADGIPGHNVRLEALHGVAGAGCWSFYNGTTVCPTVFPGGGSLGASFNRSSWEAMGSAIGDEIRAYNNQDAAAQMAQGADIFAKGLNDGRGVGLTEWGPSLNMYRDPRWGQSKRGKPSYRDSARGH